MRTALISAAALAAAALIPAAATAQAAKPAAKPAAKATGSATPTEDVRCMLAMVAFANVNKDHPQAGQAGVYFFAGRLSARAPTLDLTTAVKAQAPTMGPQQLQDELKRCGPMVEAQSQKFQAAIAALRPPGAAPAGPGPSPAAPPAAPAPK